MYSKFWKASLCFSTAYALMPDTPFSTSYKTQSDPNKDELTKAQKEAILARLLLDRQKKVQAQNKTQERIPKERHHFFEKPILESFSKIALYHLLGFIGYLPYVSTAANYLILPLIPFNIASDASIAYLYANESQELKSGGNSWTSKEVGKIADYLSYAFAFASSGGAAKGVPGLFGMMASMYIYTKFNKDNFNKTGLIMSGALGGTIPTVLLSQTFTFWIGKHKRIPFALGIFASYVAFSSLISRLMEDYMASRNEDKISTVVLSSYKWSYLYLMGLWTLFGTPESEM